MHLEDFIRRSEQLLTERTKDEKGEYLDMNMVNENIMKLRLLHAFPENEEVEMFKELVVFPDPAKAAAEEAEKEGKEAVPGDEPDENDYVLILGLCSNFAKTNLDFCFSFVK